jgi:hypothetical protein
MNCSNLRSALVLSALTLAAGCEQKRESSAGSPTASTGRVDRLKGDAKDAVTTTTAYLIQQKEQVQKSLGEKMTDLDKQFSDLKTKAGQGGDRLTGGWSNVLSDLQQKKQAAAEKLEQLKNGGMDKWQDLKGGAEAAFADLEKSLRDAFARSKEEDPPGKL